MKEIPIIIWETNEEGDEVHGIPSSVALWSADSSQVRSIWLSQLVGIEEFGIEKREKNTFYVFEQPSAFLITGKHAYLGLDTGRIDKIKLSGENISSINRFQVSDAAREWDYWRSKEAAEAPGSAERMAALEKQHALPGPEKIPSLFSLERLVHGLKKIRAIAYHKGNVYDCSTMGLFNTETGKRLRDQWINSLVEYDGRLCSVPELPSYITMLETDSRETLNAGDLIDVCTGKVIVSKINPSRKPDINTREYVAAGNRIFMHHGAWNDEKISCINIRTGKVDSTIYSPASTMFSHKGRAYDLRQDNDVTYLMLSSEPDFGINAIYETSNQLSARSLGDLGILVSEFDDGENTSRVFRLDEPDKTLLEREGHITFI